jgi:hypothetical protein
MATAMFAGHPQTPKLHIDDEIWRSHDGEDVDVGLLVWICR